MHRQEVTYSEAVKTILGELSGVLADVSAEQVESFLRALGGAKRIFATGEGRSGMAARAFAMRLMHLGLESYVIGDAVSPRIQAGDVVVVVSGSGKTARTLAAAKAAKAAGARVATVSASPSSGLAKLADEAIILPRATRSAAPSGKKSAQPLDSLFDQAAYLLLDAVVMILQAKLGRTQEDMAARHADL